MPHNKPSPSDPASADQANQPQAGYGEDVMKVLDQVEEQLNRLRAVRKDQDDSIASLVTRSKALKDAEEQIEKARRELDGKHKEVHEAQEQVRQKNAQTDQARKLVDTERQALATQGENLRRRQTELEHKAAELAEHQGALEAERQRITALHKQCEKHQDEQSKRAAQLEEQNQEMAKRLEQAERNVGELIQQVESTNTELAAKSKELKKAGTETPKLQKRITQLEQTLEEAEKRAERAARETAEKAGELQHQLSEASAKMKAAEKRSAALEADVNQLKAQLADSHQKLERTGKKLSQFAQVLSEQTPQLERGAAAIAMVQQQAEQIDHLTKQLAAQALGSDPQELQRRDERIAQLTEALRQARGQSAGDQDTAALEQRNAELVAELNEYRLAAQNAQVALEAANRQLAEQAQAQSAPAAHDASIAEHAAKVAALTAEIEQLHAKAAIDTKSKLDAQSKRHRQELSEVQQAETAALKELRERVAQLQDELRQARTQPSSAAPSDGSLREKAERITAVANHLRRRRYRLIRVRQLLRAKQNSGGTPSERMKTEELIKLDRERIQLADLRKVLEQAERKMIKRWARSRAVVSVGWLSVIAVVCAVGSWLIADQIAPAKRSASVVIEGRDQSKQTLTAAQAEAWQDWHIEFLESPTLHKALAKRFGERRIDQYADPAQVAQRLRDDLRVDDAQHGLLVLTLAGYDSDELTLFLDLLTATVVAESNRQASQRSDTARTLATGERRDGGRVRYASMNATTISDERIKYAGPIFGVVFAVSLVMVVVGYRQFSKAKRVFDEENSQLFND